MSRNVKKLCIVGGCLVGCGITLSLIGAAFGAKTSVTYRNGSWHVQDWEDSWYDEAQYAMNDGMEISRNEVSKAIDRVNGTTSSGKYSYDTGYVQVDAFEHLDIDLDAIAVEIIQGDDYAIELKYRSNKKIDYEVRKGVLTMEQPHFSNNLGVNQKEGKVTIYIPEDVVLGDVEIDNGLGSVAILDREMNTLDLSVGLGSVSLKDTTIQNLMIEGGMGSVKSENLISYNTEVSVAMGAVELEGDLQGDIIIEGGMGSVKVNTIRSYDDYNYILEKGMGTIRINGQSSHGLKDVHEDNGAQYKIQVEGGMGDIEVNTAE